MATISEGDINNGEPLSDEQVKRIEVTVAALAKRSNNGQAVNLAHNLKMSKTIEEKRRHIVSLYMACYQLITFVNMGRDEEIPLESYHQKLLLLFKDYEDGRKRIQTAQR